MDISAIRSIDAAPVAGKAAATEATPGAGETFGDLIGHYTQDVNGLPQQADQAVADLAAGKIDNVHQVVMALGKAEISFKLMMEMRNKMLDAYHEVMRMPV